mmetsp:Transcript_20644/g.55163  ORF Transcript_20644/g.55163 Transcript_20644/m.55163 type:complete len:288 (+) Transcript_20644:91-954(+)
MSDSVYRKTPLPVRLNLNDRNTKEQLSVGTSEAESGRGTLEGVGLAQAPASQSQKNCTDVMRKDLKEWLARKGLEGPPSSAEAEQRAMWEWMRDFHKEYNDDWFARNMPRLHKQFRPIFMEEMKEMKAKAAPPALAPAFAADLLDFGGSQAASSTSRQVVVADDLLSLDAPASAPSAPSAVPSEAMVPAAVPAAPLVQGLDGLLDLGVALPTVAEMPAPALAAAPAPALAAPAPVGGGLLDLGLDLGGAVAMAPPATAATPSAGAPVGAPVVAPASTGKNDLLDLVF